MARSVTVSISETYDLHTIVDKMTLIGIHTPKKDLIMKTYPGLCENYKYFRIKSVDVALSTAQTLALSVDQIGLDENKIRPQDMMNPILYKAVSNDSWNTLEARIKGIVDMSGPVAPSTSGCMAVAENDFVTGLDDEHNVYYSLLANREGFRMAQPRQGLRMRGLKPLVFEKLYNFGVNMGGQLDNQAPAIGETGTSDNPQLSIYRAQAYAIRGRARRMPRINTSYLTGITAAGETRGSNFIENGMGSGTPGNHQIQMPQVPPVMLGAIVLPPCTATTGILYYRMVTRCWIEFSGVRPIQDVTSFSQMDSAYADYVYHSDYEEQSSKMDATTDMVDVKNAEIEKIMEGR